MEVHISIADCLLLLGRNISFVALCLHIGVGPLILDFWSGLIRRDTNQHQLCDHVVDPHETASVGHTKANAWTMVVPF